MNYLYGHRVKEGENIPGWLVKRTINGMDYVCVVAPDIYTVYTPELQKTHPYAFMAIVEIAFKVYSVELRFLKEIEYSSPGYLNTTDGVFYRYKPDTGDYWYSAGVGGDGTYHNTSTFHWANFDVLAENGELYLAKADCVSISPLNHAALMQGFSTMLSLKK